MCVVQHSLSLGLYGDDPGEPEYLELEVGVAGDGHEQDSDNYYSNNPCGPLLQCYRCDVTKDPSLH
jgi:hypothetical protein